MHFVDDFLGRVGEIGKGDAVAGGDPGEGLEIYITRLGNLPCPCSRIARTLHEDVLGSGASAANTVDACLHETGDKGI